MKETIVIPVLHRLPELREVTATSVQGKFVTLEIHGGPAALRMAEQRLLRGGVAATLEQQAVLLRGIWSQPLGPTRIKLHCQWAPA